MPALRSTPSCGWRTPRSSCSASSPLAVPPALGSQRSPLPTGPRPCSSSSRRYRGVSRGLAVPMEVLDAR